MSSLKNMLVAGAVAAAGFGGTAQAAEILVDGANNIVTITAFDPLGQSFLAPGSDLQTIGVQFATLGTGAADVITATLRAGDGTLAGGFLAQRTVTLPTTLPGRNDAKFFTEIDFSGVSLVSGSAYTIAFTSNLASGGRTGLVYGPTQLTSVPPTYEVIDRYVPGQLYTTGNLCGTRTCDLNFHVVANDVAGPVPEPATWAMMIGGFGMVGGALRRRGRTDAAVA